MRFGIIAAGDGNRLVQEGCNIPKPLVRIGGVPMVERLANIFLRNNAERIAIIVNEQQPQTIEHVRCMSRTMPIDLVVRSTPTPMHSLMELSPYLDGGPFCATTVDTVFDPLRFCDMMHSFSILQSHGLMGVTTLVDDEKPLYVNVDSGMRIRSFDDEPGSCRYVSAGVYALPPTAFNVLSDCIDGNHTRMRHFQRSLLQNGVVLEAFDMGRVIDVDHIDDISKAEQLF